MPGSASWREPATAPETRRNGFSAQRYLLLSATVSDHRRACALRRPTTRAESDGRSHLRVVFDTTGGMATSQNRFWMVSGSATNRAELYPAQR